MKRVLTFASTVPLLLAVAAPAEASGTPPPTHYTADQLARGLLDDDQIPQGYTDAGTSTGTADEFEVFGSTLCDGGTVDLLRSVPTAEQSFANRTGGRLDIRITATGAGAAREIVDFVGRAPDTCPEVTRGGFTTRYNSLPLPGDHLAAGISSVIENPDYPTEHRHAMALAVGDVAVVVEETGGDEDTSDFLAAAEAVMAEVTDIVEDPALTDLEDQVHDDHPYGGAGH
ncbi:MAG TPA: hypothetical protein VN408_07485 [Actinoplanes sp.]|nr:hypothetical protein [Actinoplanes sp.]